MIQNYNMQVDRGPPSTEKIALFSRQITVIFIPLYESSKGLILIFPKYQVIRYYISYERAYVQPVWSPVCHVNLNDAHILHLLGTKGGIVFHISS